MSPSASLAARRRRRARTGPSGTRQPPRAESSASSISSAQSIPFGPFSSGMQRLRRQRLELGRQLAGPVGERSPARRGARAAARSARPPAASRGRPTSPPSARARGAARRGRGRRRSARAAASRGRAAGSASSGEAVEHGEERVGLAKLAGNLGARPGTSTTRIAAGVTFFEPTTSASRSSRSSAMTAIPRFGFCATSAYAVTCAPARVSALKSVVFPELGRPTMPTRSAMRC